MAFSSKYGSGRGVTVAATRYCCDMELPIVWRAFAKRNWTRVEAHQDWNIYWTSVANARSLLGPDSTARLGEHQRVNHFATHFELTRKDLLAKHIKRYQRQRRGRGEQEDLAALPSVMVPATFLLPRDYSMFVDEYRRVGPSLWIVKPCGKAQGIGIKLVDKPSQVKALMNSWEAQGNREPHVVCRYVDPPLLVGGRKFDLRLYVLVTSFQPLRAYLEQVPPRVLPVLPASLQNPRSGQPIGSPDQCLGPTERGTLQPVPRRKVESVQSRDVRERNTGCCCCSWAAQGLEGLGCALSHGGRAFHAIGLAQLRVLRLRRSP
ncbi:polyglutamylase complex subunit TTLL1-like isoform X2 [Haemaphysalis longicornis]